MLKPAELYTHTHTHTHTQLKRCRDFLCKLCLGAVLIFTPIFSFSATLPSGYTELEYIESSGAQYINTGVYAQTGSIVEVDYQITSDRPSGSYDWQAIYGTARGNPAWPGYIFSTLITIRGKKYSLYYNGITDLYDSNIDTARHIIRQESEKFYLDGNPLYTRPTATYTNSAPVWLFSRAGEDLYMKGRIYSAKIWSDGTNLSFNGIPAKRNSDGVVGLYDTVNGVFYTNSGTGDFIAGPAVSDEPSCEYTRLEYIESSGTQYIDTGINADSDLGVDFKYQFTSVANPQRIGAIYDNGNDTYVRHHLNVWGRLDNHILTEYFFENSIFSISDPGDTNIHTFVLDTVNKKYIVDGNINSYSVDNFDTGLNYWLFIRNSNNPDLYSPSSMRIYYFKIKDNGTLVRDLIPAKRNSDGALGMYDTVTNTFFTNAGSGTFTAGPEIVSGDICSATISITWGGLSEPEASGMCVYGETFTAPSIAPTAPSGLKFLGWRPIGQ